MPFPNLQGRLLYSVFEVLKTVSDYDCLYIKPVTLINSHLTWIGTIKLF